MSMKRYGAAAVAVGALLWGWTGPTLVSGQETNEPEMIHMCYKPGTGVVYRVNPPDQPGQDPLLKDECIREDVQFSWAQLPVFQGNVGIGVPEPAVALDVAGDVHASGKLTLGNTIEINDATNSITSTSGTISFGDENLVTSGTVESTSGGFKFPDGTVQTTAGLGADALGGEGDYSIVIGSATQATAGYATAIGVANLASGYSSTALGSNTVASNNNSVALGWNSHASGQGSMALGNYTMAEGENSLAMGDNTLAKGMYSTAMGHQTEAAGPHSTAMGLETDAIGNGSTAMGWRTVAEGDYSTAMGYYTQARGAQSTAMGDGTYAIGPESVAMGRSSAATGPASLAVGYLTTASEQYSTAMGTGTRASGSASTAMGLGTWASGENSLAMGFKTTANGRNSAAMGSFASSDEKEGAFVFGDLSTAGTESWVESPSDNSFTVRASGGVYLYTSPDLSTGMVLAAGSSGWEETSDRNLKENFRDEDGEQTLKSIAAMPIQSWNYKAQDPSIRHIGPMAQDFYAAFGLGTDDKHINTVDIDGVNMLAIQALEKRTTELRAENEYLRSRIADLEAALLRLEAAVSPVGR